MQQLSKEMVRKFSDIFSFWVRRIQDGEQDSIEPGELCIRPLDGGEGAILYWRDPITGELITPNTLEDLDIILDHFNKEDGTFSADLVSGMRFYTSIYDLDIESGVNYTADTVIAAMVNKSILIAPIEFEDDFRILQWPSASGLAMITKLSNGFVRAEYVDTETSNVYNGIYDAKNHLFIRWQMSEVIGANYVVATGDETHIRADTDTDVLDFEVFSVKTPYQLQPSVQIELNDSGYLPIVNVDGSELDGVIPMNSIIMMTYDSYRKCWVYLSEDHSIESQLMQIMSLRLASQTGDLTNLIDQTQQFIIDTSDMIGAMQDRIDELERAQEEDSSKLVCEYINITIDDTNASQITLTTEQFNAAVDYVIVNYEQTVLQSGIDYTIDTAQNAIVMAKALDIGTSVQLIVIKQPA